MKKLSFSSSLFGRLSGHTTYVQVDKAGLTIAYGETRQQVSWLAQLTPPHFYRGWLGQSCLFRCQNKSYLLSKLAYRSGAQAQDACRAHWIKAHQPALQQCLAQIAARSTTRYLRHSDIAPLQQQVQREYEKWFPWSSACVLAPALQKMLSSLSAYQHAPSKVFAARRARYIEKQLLAHQRFFDRVESNPLTLQQRRACIIDDDNNLLLAGAGTGKTSVMVGRAGYLVASGQARHGDILLLAYGRKAANEMDERLQDKLSTPAIRASTFHQLGLQIITAVEGNKPRLSALTEDVKAKNAWLKAAFMDCLERQKSYRTFVLEYLAQPPSCAQSPDAFSSQGAYYQHLSEHDVRSFQGEKVINFGHLAIANWLFMQGIEYRYQTPYAVALRTPAQQSYRPDFFLPAFNLYIEYAEIDAQGQCPAYRDNAAEHAAIAWQRETHRAHQTPCLSLHLGQLTAGTLLASLGQSLKARQPSTAQQQLARVQAVGALEPLVSQLCDLIGLVKAACLDAAATEKMIAQSAEPPAMRRMLALVSPLLQAYQAELTARGEIDFDDMIVKAIRYVEQGKFQPPWRYIMVDEFQDISKPRARLVKALRDNRAGASVFAVGDDWQAIYRFSGADVALTTQFARYFGATTQTQLDKTFRFNNSIAEVASQFISKNPAQFRKTIHAVRQVNTPAISILRRPQHAKDRQTVAEVSNGALETVLQALAAQVTQPRCVYLLARYWHQLPDAAACSALSARYPMLNIEALSVHASKGKEADYVVLIGLTTGEFGFPASQATEPVVEALLAPAEPFAHAEERRLFYVALTRAKHRVYVIADTQQASDFVHELSAEHAVTLDEFPTTAQKMLVDKVHCKLCKTGTLTARKSEFGDFYSCVHFPRCTYKVGGCRQCNSMMSQTIQPGFNTCLNPNCQEQTPLCTRCGGEMTLRKGAKGAFWGCVNFKGNEAMSCKQTLAPTQVAWPTRKHSKAGPVG